MSQNQQTNTNGIFSFLYHTRIKVMKAETTIVNLSLLFFLVSLLCAPWLVIIGAVVAMLLGYRFSLIKKAEGFSESWNNVVHKGAEQVKNVVEQFGKNDEGNQGGMEQ